MIQLFVVAGAYGFALFENRETQTRWRAFADLAFVRVVLSFLSLEIRKLIQPLGKSIYINKRKIRKNMLSSLIFLTYRD